MFSRIYLGIFVSIILAGFSSYGLYQYDYQKRLAELQASALSGVMQLVQDTLARQQQLPTTDNGLSAEQRQQKYLDIVAKLLTAKLTLLPLSEHSLSSQQLGQLRMGLMVKQSLDTQTQRWWLWRDDNRLAYFDTDVVTEQQFRGQLLLLLAEFKRLSFVNNSQASNQKVDEAIASLQSYSAYSMQLLPAAAIPELTLSAQQTSRLQRGSVVISNDSQNQQQFTVYGPITNQMGVTHLLQLGPINRFNSLPLSVAVSMLISAVLIIVIITSLLVYRLQTRFNSIKSMVDAFGSGELGARIHLTGRDVLVNLSQHINTMANQIQALLLGQRATMQAVSHELRTPLSRIRFRLTMLDEDVQDQSHLESKTESMVTQKTKAIRNDVSQIEGLIEEVLAHHKLAQAPELQMTKTDISKVIHNAIDQQTLLYQHIEINAELEPVQSIPAHLGSIERLLANLISNACKHANQQVLIRLTHTEQQLMLSIEDDGAGIEAAERDRVFDAFYRVDSSRNKQTGGHGLGLAIVKRIVDLHQANIEIAQSERLGGAAFIVTFMRSAQKQSGS